MSKSRGRPFQPGNSFGQGRPKGRRNKATLLAKELFAEHADAVGRKCVSMALKGDATCMRLCMERMHPVRRGVPVEFEMPPVRNTVDLAAAINSVLQAMAKGQLTPDDGSKFLSMLESLRGIVPKGEDVHVIVTFVDSKGRELPLRPGSDEPARDAVEKANADTRAPAIVETK